MIDYINITLRHEDIVRIAAIAIREAIKTDAWMRTNDMLDKNDTSNVMLEEALEYFDGYGETEPCKRFDHGFQAGVFANAPDIGMVCYQLGRREERERCAWIAEHVADGRGTDWDTACYAVAEQIRGSKDDTR